MRSKRQIRGITLPPKERKPLSYPPFCLQCVRPINAEAVAHAYRESKRFECECGRVLSHGK